MCCIRTCRCMVRDQVPLTRIQGGSKHARKVYEAVTARRSCCHAELFAIKRSTKVPGICRRFIPRHRRGPGCSIVTTLCPRETSPMTTAITTCALQLGRRSHQQRQPRRRHCPEHRRARHIGGPGKCNRQRSRHHCRRHFRGGADPDALGIDPVSRDFQRGRQAASAQKASASPGLARVRTRGKCAPLLGGGAVDVTKSLSG